MRHVITTVLLFMMLCGPSFGNERSFGGVELLDGYSVRRGSAVDAVNWTIQGKNGLTIHFESGPSEGRAVDPKEKDRYAWYREQTVRGHKVLLALVKPGLKTEPDLDSERNPPPGNILLVTFPLSGHRDHAANFVGKVANQEEMVDMLLTVLTFDPSKGNF